MEIGIRALRAQLSHYIELVRGGEEVVVTERGKPVARLVGTDNEDVITDLVARGVVRLPDHRRLPSRTVTRVRSAGSVADLVRDQRR
jgi:prevent-host-death family protein